MHIHPQVVLPSEVQLVVQVLYKAYDRLLGFALRAEPLIRSVADKTPAQQSIPGSTIVLQSTLT